MHRDEVNEYADLAVDLQLLWQVVMDFTGAGVTRRTFCK